MEKTLKFNSQVATNRSQSERLIALGLKKETADMVWTHAYYGTWVVTASENPLYEESDSVPAWSLHRLLLLLLDNRCVAYDHISFSIDETDVFTKVINHIEWLIKEGYFNKKYLEE